MPKSAKMLASPKEWGDWIYEVHSLDQTIWPDILTGKSWVKYYPSPELKDLYIWVPPSIICQDDLPLFNSEKLEQTTSSNRVAIENSDVSRERPRSIPTESFVINQGEKMSEQTGKSPNPSRKSQLGGGFKQGLKKGTVKVVSEKASQAIAGALPVSGLPAERIVQLILLGASAELVERVPDGVANKVGLTEERRKSFGALSRHLGGEIVGRDAVELVSQLAPYLVDAFSQLSQLSASDIQESAEELVAQPEQIEAKA